MIAFLLGFFPGGGLLYLGKVRGLFYLFVIFAIGFGSLMFAQMFLNDAFIFLGIGGVFLMYIVNIVDTMITASKYIHVNGASHTDKTSETHSSESERFFAIVLSFIPGLGHFQLGLMNRGLTLLVSFFGLGAMILFVTVLTGHEVFFVFLLMLPVIWIYGFFDVLHQLDKKKKGEELVDRSIFEDFEARREVGKKKQSACDVSFNFSRSRTPVFGLAAARHSADGGFPVFDLHFGRASSRNLFISRSDHLVLQLF